MRFVIPFLLGLSWLARAVPMASQDGNITAIEARAGGGGFRSVAYFVNWVSSTAVVSIRTNRLFKFRPSMEEIMFLKIYLLIN
jgi:hypothetical protein